MKIVNEAISNKKIIYKRGILPLLLSSSITDLFMIFLNILKDLILRVLESILFHIFGP